MPDLATIYDTDDDDSTINDNESIAELNNEFENEQDNENDDGEQQKNVESLVEEIEGTLDDAVTDFHNATNDEKEPDDASDDGMAEEEQKSTTYTTRYGREVHEVKNYTPDYSNIAYNNAQTTEEDYTQIIGILMQQLSLRQGLQQFGEEGDDAAYAEMKQLHMRDSFAPKLPSELTKEQMEQVLESIMLLKQKKDGTIKGRNCADGRKQRDFTEKWESSSPTAKLESILITAVIDAHEGRDVVTTDIPNAFIQTRVDNPEDRVIMRFRGRLVNYLCSIAPEIYKPYVVVENGKRVLYCETLNAMYGTLKAAILFYKKLVKDLQGIGFECNPYDICVMNRMIKGVQQTVVFHVDDLKASCVNKEANDELIQFLKGKYEIEGLPALKATRGTRHDFLGMTLDFSTPKKVIVDMKEYVKEMIEFFKKYMTEKEAKTPAADWLFEVRENVNKLDKECAELFHTMVAKGLFLCKRARPDIQTAVAFLSTRVRDPDDDDWKKLLRMMQYLKGTADLVLTLSADGTNILKWYVDASYAIHPDMKGHTGGYLTMGEGGIINKSQKQKLNAKSSTEAELISTDDVLPDCLWTGYFIEAQGYGAYKTIINRDNKATMLLETNGVLSSSKRTKHINVRYFFIKDKIDKGEVSIQYCPTEAIIADFYTNPLQGNKFKEFRKSIMNLQE